MVDGDHNRWQWGCSHDDDKDDVDKDDDDKGDDDKDDNDKDDDDDNIEWECIKYSLSRTRYVKGNNDLALVIQHSHCI